MLELRRGGRVGAKRELDPNAQVASRRTDRAAHHRIVVVIRKDHHVPRSKPTGQSLVSGFLLKSERESLSSPVALQQQRLPQHDCPIHTTVRRSRHEFRRRMVPP